MPVITFSKAPDEANASALLTKFFERLQIESDGSAICVLEFIVQVKDDSPSCISKLDIIVPHVVSGIEDVTETFEDPNITENQAYTEGFKHLDDNSYKIDGVVAYLMSLSSTPEKTIRDNCYSEIRVKFNEINIGDSGAFRLKMIMPDFAKIYESVGIFELSLYYSGALSSRMERMQEWGVNGIPIDRKLCETWVILPTDTLCGKAIPPPQQIKVRHIYKILSRERLETPRSAVYWDLEDTAFDLPGRSLGDYIKPSEGVRIYCETAKPHVASEAFNTTMNDTLSTIERLKESAINAEESLRFISKFGKKSFVITLFFSIIAIILALIGLAV